MALTRDAGICSRGLITLLLAGCGTTQITPVTPWLRNVTHKETSFDSGGRSHLSVEVRRDGEWSRLPEAVEGTPLDGGRRVAVRRSDGSVVLLTEAGAVDPVPACTDRAMIVSPDGQRLVCFEQGLMPLGFVGDTFYATDELTPGNDVRICRLVSVSATGETHEERRDGSWARGCAPDLWDDLVDRTRLR